MRRLVCLITGLLTIPASAAILIDFEDVGPGTFPSVTRADVTFTASDGGDLTSQDYGPTPNSTWGLIGVYSVWFPPLRADIAGGATEVWVDLGDLGFDADDLFLQAYDAGNVLVDSDALTIPPTFNGMERLYVAAPDIAYVIYGSVGDSGSSVFSDNFMYTPVPEPAMLGLLGLAVLGVPRRR